jgi:hypothetical protein
MQNAARLVDVDGPQAAKLGAANTGRVEHLHDRPVPQPNRI